ncbi:Aminotransferase class-III [Sulfitobacter noctilucicola]|uniref:4-aminobutyrate aminotransferase-like enzyme n=1 Tax=Sulfitobacter noctilucicola TaxID=1342301 RepID=A0A7W6Q6K6_9RHOB|nr:aspartate aminotransferase family protein [Sulfitobacter noctilucicola]KIN63592.1 Aminotransferase class-III [Sulfitobacter noctilucicola]MBB4174895.1 4-aminobutyrate aminotransferase-like enzyme [Sulfitobacter noctilucicola]
MSMANAYNADQDTTLGAQDAALIARRTAALGPAYRLFYQEPLHLVRGEGVWLWDTSGKEYLDAYNNVASVGHCHPKVVKAISGQLGILNTHTRYLHDSVVTYAERLLSTMPAELAHAMFTCTGSEANDLALRIARSYTKREGIIVTKYAYHGVTEAVSQLSPSLGAYGTETPRVAMIPAPDGAGTSAGEEGAKFAAELAKAIAALRATGIEPAALIVDTVFSSDGLFTDPVGFLEPAADLIRAEGGLFIADEVQAGFGRTGDAMWGFQRHGLIPDLVSMGKPMGNGFPVAGVAMRPDLIAEFGTKARYFNTFGGNPVAAAAGMAVLDVLRDEGLLENSKQIGGFLKAELETLCAKRNDVAAVRGAGLFLAVDIASQDGECTLDAARAIAVVNHMRANGVLISATGPHASTLKIRPPLVLQKDQACQLLTAISDAFDATA